MGELKYDFSKLEILWGHSYLMGTDLEKIEYDKNFAELDGVYISIFDDEPVYQSIINYREEPLRIQSLSKEDDEENADVDLNENDDTANDRDSYRDTDQDNVYYLI